MSTPGTEELRDLILHRLPESRARELEDRLMLVEDCAERLQDATYDLLDDYARGRLTAADRAAIERYVLASPENRWNAAVARCIAQRISATPPQRPERKPARTWELGALLAACAVLVAILVTRLPVGSRGTPAKHSAETAARATLAVPTVALLANASRGLSPRAVSIPPGAMLVRLQAEVAATADARRYRLEVLNGAGRTLYSAAHLVPHSAGAYVYVEADVPARALAPASRVLVATERAGARGSAAFSWDIRIQTAH